MPSDHVKEIFIITRIINDIFLLTETQPKLYLYDYNQF